MSYSTPRLRRALVIWLYAVAVGHLAVSLILTWAGHRPPASGYLGAVERAFWTAGAPEHVRALQTWWLGLFGATLQSYSVFMLALVYLGHTLRAPAAWLGLGAGVLLWAPQDAYLSLQARMWANLGFDAIALLVLLPPLAWLHRHDRAAASLPTHPPDHG